ncbi:MAG: dTMP kinase [Planctomycetota bacterium]
MRSENPPSAIRNSQSAHLAEKLAGRFIVFDGPDGCGKSTQRQMLGDLLNSAGGQVVHCKDPGGTAIGERIRHVLLGYDLAEMDVRCETMLFMASRAQLVGELIEPALADGKIVLCDRFVSATCAYQGAQGYDIRRVIEVAPYAIEGFQADRAQSPPRRQAPQEARRPAEHVRRRSSGRDGGSAGRVSPQGPRRLPDARGFLPTAGGGH